ncbi:dynamin family protein [Clostridium perfringens]
MLDKYNEKKNKVIDIVKSYIEFEEKNPDLNGNVNMDSLKRRLKAIEDSKYILAVVGEVKAGKSTFINALLGEKVLPSDVLQSTSSVIEIFKSDEKVLKITYADNHIEEKRGNDIEEFLKNNACVQEEYREIPTVTIDSWIMSFKTINEYGIKLIYNKLQKERESFIESLFEHNIHQLEKNTFKSKVEKYIDEKTNLKNIIEKIELGYPLKYKFDSLRLVDSPGVNAKGGLEDLTYNYVQNADATIFVKPIKPVESKSFNEFFNKIVTDKKKDTVFLVLSHISSQTEEQIRQLREETERIYSQIEKERIIPVDSLLREIEKKFESMNEDEIVSYLYDGDLNEEKEIAQKLVGSYVPNLLRGKINKEEFIYQITKASNFENIDKAINTFAMTAKDIQLRDILISVCNGYDNILANIDKKIKLLKIEDRQVLEKEIKKKKEELIKLKEEYGFFEKKLYKEYNVLRGPFREFTNSKNEKLKKISNCTEFLEIEKETQNIIDEGNEVLNKSIKDLCEDFSEFFDDKITEEANKISIPKLDFESIIQESKEESYIEPTNKKICFENDKTPIYSKEKHLNIVRINITKAINNEFVKARDIYIKTISLTKENIRSEFENTIKKENDFLDGYMKRKINIEKAEKELENLNEIKLDIFNSNKECKKICKNLKC